MQTNLDTLTQYDRPHSDSSIFSLAYAIMDSPNQANEEDEKMKRVAILCFTSILLISLSGCRYISMVLEKDKTAFNDTITALFLALDEGDSEAIYNLFSPSVRKQDQDLKEQIEQLLSIYEGPVEKIAWDGLGGRSNVSVKTNGDLR